MSHRRIHFFLDFFEIPYPWERDFFNYLNQDVLALTQFERILREAGYYIPLHDIRPRLSSHHEHSITPPFGQRLIDTRLTWVFYQDWFSFGRGTCKFNWDDRSMVRADFSERANHVFRINYLHKPREQIERMVELLQYNPELIKALNIPDCIRGENPLKTP